MSPSAQVVVAATVQVKPDSQDEALAAITTATLGDAAKGLL